MGVRLLNRTTRRQSLTEFGVAYYDRCGLVLAEAQAAKELAADQLTRPSGRLRVALPVLFGRRCITPVLLELAQRYPGLELDLSFDDCLVDLAEGGFDLAIRAGALADSASVIAKRVARQRMICLCFTLLFGGTWSTATGRGSPGTPGRRLSASQDRFTQPSPDREHVELLRWLSQPQPSIEQFDFAGGRGGRQIPRSVSDTVHVSCGRGGLAARGGIARSAVGRALHGLVPSRGNFRSEGEI